MGTKTLTITEDAYERLKSHKRADESFSDVVTRLAPARANPSKARGLFDESDADVDHDEHHARLGEESTSIAMKCLDSNGKIHL